MEMIEIKNNLGRPVLFRIPGSSIRLGPGESVSLPAVYMETSELNQLLRKQALSLIPRREPEDTADTKSPGNKPAAKDGKRGKRGKTKPKDKIKNRT